MAARTGQGINRRANLKLPLGGTISLAYSSYFQYFGDALRITWLWLLLIAPLAGVTSWLQMSWFAELVASARSGTRLQTLSTQPIEMIIFQNISTLAVLFAGVSIAVAWHRRLLLNELPGFSGSNVGTPSLWHYVGVGLLICLTIGLPALAILAPMYLLLRNAVTNAPSPVFIVAGVLLEFVGFAVLLRLSLLFPARAVGDLSLTFKEVWNRTSGNTWRLFWGIMACTTPPLAIVQLGVLILGGFPDPRKIYSSEMTDQWVVTSLVSTSYYLLVMPICIGFISYAYQFFFIPAQRNVQ